MSRANRGRERRLGRGPQTAPFWTLQNPYSPVEVLSADQVEHIHQSSLTLLAKSGMRVLAPIWRQLLEESESPHLDAAIDEALTAFVAHRKEALR